MPQVMEGTEEGGEEEEGKDPLLQRIKKEPCEMEEEDDESSTIQIRVCASTPRLRDSGRSSDRVRG